MTGEEILAAAGGAAVAEAPAEGATEEVVETPAEETSADGGAAPEAGEQPTEEIPEGKEGEQPEEEADYTSGDGRKILDAKLRKGIAALRKTDKIAAKAVADAYFAKDAIMKELPDAKSAGDAIQSIRGMKATIEALGGEQGIADIQEEVSDWRNEAKQFAEGDPELIAKLGEADPEALVTNAHNVLDWLRDYKKGELFENAILPAFTEKLEGAGFFNALDSLAGFIKEGKGQEAWDLLQRVMEWGKGVRANAAKFKTEQEARPKRNLEREEIDREREQLNNEKVQNFNQNVNSNLAQINNRSMSKIVEPFFRDLKLPHEGRREFVNSLQLRIWKMIEQDKTFQMQAKVKRAKSSPMDFAEFVSGKFSELLPREFTKLRNSMYPSWKPKGPGTGGGKPNDAAPAAGDKKPAPVATGFIQLKEQLSGDKVDWKKSSQIEYIAGRAVGKDGKRYRWAVRH